MINYFKIKWMERLRFKLIRWLGGLPTTPYVDDYPFNTEDFE